MSGLVTPRYNSLPMILLYLAASTIGTLGVDKSTPCGKGLGASVASIKPASIRMSLAYLFLEMVIPDVVLATSMPRKYFA